MLEDAVDQHEGVPAAARLAAHLGREVRGGTGRYGEGVRCSVTSRGAPRRPPRLYLPLSPFISRRTEAATSPTELPTARSISCRGDTGEI